MSRSIPDGEVNEGYGWEYHRPYRSYQYFRNIEDPVPCPHANWTSEPVAKIRPDGSIYGYERCFEIPEAAICFNEAGCNMTALCLQCADEARKAHEV